MKKLLYLTVAVTSLVICNVQSQVIAFDVQGASSPATLLATTIDADLDASSSYNTLSRVGLGANAGANSFNSNTWNITNDFDEADKYISFTLAPVAGYEMTLTGLQYALNGSNSAPGLGRWGYSINNAPFILQDTFNLTQPAPTSLASWEFTAFTTEQSVEFRFWAFGETSIGGTTAGNGGTIRVANISGNDLVLNGSVSVVPEPSTIGLLGLAGLGLAVHVIRRRRR
jgi:hypothetical protein